jgi:cytosine/adenosine deaminase-related metal-dependent hydrolase
MSAAKGPFADSPPLAIQARWVFPVDRPPLEGGIVTIAGGRIVAIGENASSRPPQDLGDVALLPGLVNAHTHLEFSLLRQPLGKPGVSFADWIRQVVAFRRHFGMGSQPQARLAGLALSRAAGVAAVGEIATAAWPQTLPAPLDELRVVVFRELLGLAAERIEPLLQIAADHVAARPAAEMPGVVAGLSPHAPYTVHPQVLKAACELSAKGRFPIAMHLAETREELELLRAHTGSLVSLLQSLGAWQPGVLPRGLRPLDYLRKLATADRALVIHGNYLALDEIDFLGAHRDRLSVVYCPRTHAYFGHEPYPLAALLAAGARVAVGTDSLASNPDLDLWQELRHVARHHPQIAPEAILRMGTLAGAEALGLDETLGSMTPGKSAQLTVARLPRINKDALVSLLHEDGIQFEPLTSVLAAESSAGQ